MVYYTKSKESATCLTLEVIFQPTQPPEWVAQCPCEKLKCSITNHDYLALLTKCPVLSADPSLPGLSLAHPPLRTAPSASFSILEASTQPHLMADKYLLTVKSCFPDTGTWEFRSILVWAGETLHLSSRCSQKQCLYSMGKLMRKPQLPNGMYLALSSWRTWDVRLYHCDIMGYRQAIFRGFFKIWSVIIFPLWL